MTPYSGKTMATYENFIADCPVCRCTNIFNRASDLRTFRPIAFRQVTCQQCGCPFSINGDSINAAYQMLLFESHDFIQMKRYMQCVLTVAQAYELFFNHFLYEQLLYRTFAIDRERDLPQLNRLTSLLYRRVRQLTFEPMRKLVLRMIVDGVAPQSLAAAERAVLAIPDSASAVQKVSRGEIEGVGDGRLRILLAKLLDADANVIRNRVVHKDAYRPKEAEARRVHGEAQEILFGLTARLRLGRSIEWYANARGRGVAYRDP
jgi:hypothetical protein